jgi:hypothetical protein
MEERVHGDGHLHRREACTMTRPFYAKNAKKKLNYILNPVLFNFHSKEKVWLMAERRIPQELRE